MILSSLHITTAKYAFIVCAIFGAYVYGQYRGKLLCAAVINQTALTAVKAQQKNERKEATQAVKHASDTAKRIQEIKEDGNARVKHIEENIVVSCAVSGNILHELKAIVDRSKQLANP